MKYLLFLLLPSLAAAQTVELDADQYKPAPTGSFFGVADTSILPKLQLQAGIFFHLVDKPFLVLDSVTNEVIELITRQNIIDLTLAVGLFDKAELYLTVPAALSQAGQDRDKLDDGPQVSGAAFGDMILGTKAKIYGDAAADGVSAAATVDLFLPTGDQAQLLGNSSTAVALSLLAQYRSGPLQFAANIGPRLQKKESFFFENLTIGSSLPYGVGASYLAHPKALVSAELDGSIALVGADASGTSPLEARLGAKINASRGLWVPLGLGVGILDGVGAPRFRLFAGIAFTPTPNQDPDKDGLVGSADKCPKEAETKNQFEDTDGCPDTLPKPDPDPDKDTFVGDKDLCPEQKGTLDGCPDADDDRIADKLDKCPNDPEDLDAFEDEDGCPDADVSGKIVDSDNDGLADPDDNCPTEPGTVATLGCPDTDGDSIADIGDACPNEAEDFKGQKDGCPEKKGTITMGKTSTIDLSERRIFFDINSDKLQKRSYETLDLVVQLITDHPEYKKISVEGHTDDVGNADTNQKLSERRAKSVMTYLIEQGIDPARLESKGYGLTRPLVQDKSREARDKNRRVEFIIVE